GAPMSAEWIQRAVDYLLHHQNDDGGWGEEVVSYRDPGRSGQGASTPGLTGLVTSALLEADHRGPALEDAVAYLLREQRPDGGWPNGTLLYTLVPPSLFYILPGAEVQQPLEALGIYLAARAGQLDGELP